MSCLVRRKHVGISLAAAILTIICPVGRCDTHSNVSSHPLTYVSFPNEPPCHILLPGETLLLSCHFDDDCDKLWCHQDPGTTAHLILPEGDSFGVSIFTRTYAKPGRDRDRTRDQFISESVLLVENSSMLDAGQYLCVCAAKSFAYKIDIAIVNVSAWVRPKCNRRVELTFGGIVQPINLTIYKWICRPYSAQLIRETTEDNSKQLEIELDIEGDTSSKVSCYFYLKSPDNACGARVISVAFHIQTKNDLCNIDFLRVSTSDSVTFSADRFRRSFLLLAFLQLTFVAIDQGRRIEDFVTRLIQLHSFDLG